MRSFGKTCRPKESRGWKRSLTRFGQMLIRCRIRLSTRSNVSPSVWLDSRGHEIRTRGAEDIARCPAQIAIVSTGLIFHDSDERQHLLSRKYGTLILDEAHRARKRGGLGKLKDEPNNLLDFMLKIGPRTKHLLLGTATPIQIDERDAWEWLRNPIPPAREDALFATLRLQFGLADRVFFTDRVFSSLGFLGQQAMGEALAPGFLRQHNPIVRHTVLRRRKTLEDAGLLDRVGVDVHPDPDVPAGAYPGVGFSGYGLLTNHPFDLAYKAAEAFTAALQKRTKAAGFMKSLLLQRICSNIARKENCGWSMAASSSASTTIPCEHWQPSWPRRFPASQLPSTQAREKVGSIETLILHRSNASTSRRL